MLRVLRLDVETFQIRRSCETKTHRATSPLRLFIFPQPTLQLPTSHFSYLCSAAAMQWVMFIAYEIPNMEKNEARFCQFQNHSPWLVPTWMLDSLKRALKLMVRVKRVEHQKVLYLVNLGAFFDEIAQKTLFFMFSEIISSMTLWRNLWKRLWITAVSQPFPFLFLFLASWSNPPKRSPFDRFLQGTAIHTSWRGSSIPQPRLLWTKFGTLSTSFRPTWRDCRQPEGFITS